MALKGLIIAAPSSGAGKTVVTLGLLRALRRQGVDICSAKSGPDYIDPAFHAAATGKACINLDAWAMPPMALRAMAHRQPSGLLLIEGAMGLFDAAPVVGNPMGKGSVADLAEVLDLPVVLVVDVARQAQTVAAVVAGLAGFRKGVRIAGVILNRVGSAKHRMMIERAMGDIPVLGMVPRDARMVRESRHLGLVQAGEDAGLEAFIEGAADVVAEGVDVAALAALAEALPAAGLVPRVAPFGQRIAVARDEAFAFAYPHMLEGWRAAGAEVSFFSPLADEGPSRTADAVFLPGGYPELHAGKLAGATRFKAAMRDSNALIYGECGGYMALGEGLVDANGVRHEMLGLLPVSTSFAARKLHLGYRTLKALAGPFHGHTLPAHEFHYASILECQPANLFAAQDSMGNDLGLVGHNSGKVSGSFAHVIMGLRI
ncbi:MAG: cobyrinate a,c-diamide synthase [Rhodobacteraceae bacterium]|nr:cobyrinate a,c-diamide synthase [Paracoccaceae bacterium]